MIDQPGRQHRFFWERTIAFLGYLIIVAKAFSQNIPAMEFVENQTNDSEIIFVFWPFWIFLVLSLMLTPPQIAISCSSRKSIRILFTILCAIVAGAIVYQIILYVAAGDVPLSTRLLGSAFVAIIALALLAVYNSLLLLFGLVWRRVRLLEKTPRAIRMVALILAVIGCYLLLFGGLRFGIPLSKSDVAPSVIALARERWIATSGEVKPGNALVIDFDLRGAEKDLFGNYILYGYISGEEWSKASDGSINSGSGAGQKVIIYGRFSGSKFEITGDVDLDWLLVVPSNRLHALYPYRYHTGGSSGEFADNMEAEAERQLLTTTDATKLITDTGTAAIYLGQDLRKLIQQESIHGNGIFALAENPWRIATDGFHLNNVKCDTAGKITHIIFRAPSYFTKEGIRLQRNINLFEQKVPEYTIVQDFIAGGNTIYRSAKIPQYENVIFVFTFSSNEPHRRNVILDSIIVGTGDLLAALVESIPRSVVRIDRQEYACWPDK